MFDKTKEELVKELRDYARDMMEKKDCTNRYRLPQITVELACLGCYFEHPGTWKDLTDEEKTNWGHLIEVEGLAEYAKREVSEFGECDDYSELAWKCMGFVSANSMGKSELIKTYIDTNEKYNNMVCSIRDIVTPGWSR